MKPPYLSVQPIRAPKLTYRKTLNDALSSSFTHGGPTQQGALPVSPTQFLSLKNSPLDSRASSRHSSLDNHSNSKERHEYSDLSRRFATTLHSALSFDSTPRSTPSSRTAPSIHTNQTPQSSRIPSISSRMAIKSSSKLGFISNLFHRSSKTPEEAPTVRSIRYEDTQPYEGSVPYTGEVPKGPGFFKRLFSKAEEPSLREFKSLEKQYKARYGTDNKGNLNAAGLGVSPAKLPRKLPEQQPAAKAAKSDGKKPQKDKSAAAAAATSPSAIIATTTVTTTTSPSAGARQMVDQYNWAEGPKEGKKGPKKAKK